MNRLISVKTARHARARTHARTHMHARTHARTQTPVHTGTQAHTWMHACTRACTQAKERQKAKLEIKRANSDQQRVALQRLDDKSRATQEGRMKVAECVRARLRVVCRQ